MPALSPSERYHALAERGLARLEKITADSEVSTTVSVVQRMLGHKTIDKFYHMNTKSALGLFEALREQPNNDLPDEVQELFDEMITEVSELPLLTHPKVPELQPSFIRTVKRLKSAGNYRLEKLLTASDYAYQRKQGVVDTLKESEETI